MAAFYPCTEDADETFIKFLLPEFACGMIIGNGGSTVTKLMADTGTNIKFSPGRECYPGTSERVCIITGKIEAISSALQAVFETLVSTSHPRAEEIAESLTNFKMLVSNIASGMVIGKSGSTIKALKNECGVNLQVSSKDENSLPERTLTITGERQNVLKVISKILTHTSGDPEASKWKRLTRYNKSSTPQVSSSASASAFASAISGLPPSRSLTQSPQGIMAAQANSLTHSAASLGYGAAAAMPNSSETAVQFLALLQQQQQAQAQSIFSALQSQKDSFTQAQLSYAYAQSLAGASSYYSKYNPVMVDGVNLQVPGGTVSTMEMAIPEIMTGSVAGAQVISDIKQSTGVRIELTGKGEYIPGTYNRKLTIVGPILSVQSAHMIFMQKILVEQERYQKQGLL